MYALAGLEVMAALSLLVGYRTNLSAFLTWFLECSLNHEGIMVDSIDCLAVVAVNQLVHLIVLPCGHVWSLDARLRRHSQRVARRHAKRQQAIRRGMHSGNEHGDDTTLSALGDSRLGIKSITTHASLPSPHQRLCGGTFKLVSSGLYLI